MALPRPEPGLVLSYSYLWREEHNQGAEEGRKARPCSVVLVTADEGGRTVVMVLPITHRPPRRRDDAVEIPSQTKARLGLDGERSWVVVTEANEFVWPGPDLRLVPGTRGKFTYGYLPPKLFRRIREAFVRHWKRGAGSRSVKRTG
ncbi:MAG: hypothetical protein K0S81_1353 [Rhodospirillales bacterium]|jgi:hypothetical protein|nr:hypothetical protein [Rhodospirillales bacterium]